jgi:hypothetical protein
MLLCSWLASRWLAPPLAILRAVAQATAASTATTSFDVFLPLRLPWPPVACDIAAGRPAGNCCGSSLFQARQAAQKALSSKFDLRSGWLRPEAMHVATAAKRSRRLGLTAHGPYWSDTHPLCRCAAAVPSPSAVLLPL